MELTRKIIVFWNGYFGNSSWRNATKHRITEIQRFLVCHNQFPLKKRKMSNAGLQLRRAIIIQAEGTRLLEKYAIAPSAARLCYIARSMHDSA
jgi:hypothetical protein